MKRTHFLVWFLLTLFMPSIALSMIPMRKILRRLNFGEQHLTFKLSASLSEVRSIRKCDKCGIQYEWEKSKSSLKMTYCTVLCEVNDLGFHLSSYERGLYEKSERSRVKSDDESDKSDKDLDQGIHIPERFPDDEDDEDDGEHKELVPA